MDKPRTTRQDWEKYINTYIRNYTFLGIVGSVDADGCCHFSQKNKFSVGEAIEIMKPDGRAVPAEVKAIYDEEGLSMPSAPHPQQPLKVALSEQADPFDILRRKEN